jgi:hypothetical protein
MSFFLLCITRIMWFRSVPNPMPGGVTGIPVPGGNKYRNMILQVGGVSKVESIKYAQLKTTVPTSCQRGLPT